MIAEPDGAELIFVFMVGFAFGMWTRRAFAGPAVYCALQYTTVWPAYYIPGSVPSILPFLIADAIVVCCGSVAGISAGALISSARLLHRRDAILRAAAINSTMFVCTLLPSVTYLAFRALLFPHTPPWASLIGIGVSICVSVGTWHVWMLEEMYIYFPSRRSVGWFVTTVGVVQVVLLAAFGASDFVLEGPDDGAIPYRDLLLRCIITTTVTLVLIVVRLSPCHRILHERSYQEHTHRTMQHFPIALIEDDSTDGSSGLPHISEKTDDDYVEYANTPTLTKRKAADSDEEQEIDDRWTARFE